MKVVSWLLASLVAAACAARGSAPPPPSASGPAAVETGPLHGPSGDRLGAAERFAGLEDRLMAAGRVHIVFDIESTDPNPSKLRGQLIWGPDEHVRIDASGSFGGAPAEIHFAADSRRMTGTSGDKTIDLPRPDDLKGSLMIGLTRMGLLHNLAVLSGGRPPDHADGTVREWVTAQPRAVDAGSLDPGQAVGLDIVVNGQPVAVASVSYVAGAALPAVREQRVQFDGGEMRVTERYETFEVEP